jgi:hypothetical protein
LIFYFGKQIRFRDSILWDDNLIVLDSIWFDRNSSTGWTYDELVDLISAFERVLSDLMGSVCVRGMIVMKSNNTWYYNCDDNL